MSAINDGIAPLGPKCAIKELDEIRARTGQANPQSHDFTRPFGHREGSCGSDPINEAACRAINYLAS